MDRRQQKTRKAIFNAFTILLSNRSYNKITVSDILEKADVGRATFYSHFETKDSLLEELCLELFDHVFESETGSKTAHSHVFDCDEKDSVFLHLFKHLEKDDHNLIKLLTSENTTLFLEYFKKSLLKLARLHLDDFIDKKPPIIPENFWVNHIASTFVETVSWWLNNGKKESAEIICEYFLLSI